MGYNNYAPSIPIDLQTQMAALQQHCGHWIPEGGSALEALDAIADGTGTFWGFNRAGQFQVGKIIIKSDGSFPTPVASYSKQQILDLSRQATEEPSWSVTTRYQRTWSPLNAQDLAGSVSGRSSFTEEWRQVSTGNAGSAVLLAYPLSKPLTIETLFDFTATSLGAAAEARRVYLIFASARNYFKARLRAPLMAIDLAQVVQITHTRYGLSTGKALFVVDIDETADGQKFEFELGLFG